MGFRGIEVREDGDRVIIRASIKDTNGDAVVTGTAELAILRLLSTGGYEVFDFDDNTFKTGTVVQLWSTLTHQAVGGGSGIDTGIWTKVLLDSANELDDWAKNDMITAIVRHDDAYPERQEHEFQYGGGVLADICYIKNSTAAVDKLFQVFETDWALNYNNSSKRWVLGESFGGLFDLTITVDDGTDPIVNALVRIRTPSFDYWDYTDSNGDVVFGVNALSYTIAISAPGFFFTPVVYAVTGNAAVTYSMTPVTITPSEPGLTTGFLTAYSVLGLPLAGVSVFIAAKKENPEEETPLTGIALPTIWREAVSDGSGLVTFTNLIKGMTYSLRRGSVASLRNEVRFTIPLDADTSYELPAIVGEDA